MAQKKKLFWLDHFLSLLSSFSSWVTAAKKTLYNDKIHPETILNL